MWKIVLMPSCWIIDLLTKQLSALCSPQICVGKLEDGEMFLKLSSGKKRGLVPAESIEEIWAATNVLPLHLTSSLSAALQTLHQTHRLDKHLMELMGAEMLD